MSIDYFGWTPRQLNYSIVAGASGSKEFVLTVTQQDGSPIPSYDGWTCEIAFFVGYATTAALTKTPAVTGDAIAKTLSFILEFDPEDTIGLKPADYLSTVWMTDPTNSGKGPAARITLTVENHDI